MPVSKEAVSELRKRCGLSAAQCKKALAAHDGDVNAALNALIEDQKVTSSDLNPDTVDLEFFERAAKCGKLAMYEKTLSGEFFGGLMKNLGKANAGKAKINAETLKNTDISKLGLGDLFQAAMAEKFGNKTPQQLMEEDEKKEKARLKKVYATMPGLKGKKPPTAGEQARSMAQIKRRSARLKQNPVTLKLKPFPPLSMSLSEWSGTDTLKSWAGTQERHGAYTSRSSSKPSKGTVKVEIPRRGDDDENPLPPSKEQIAAYEYLKKNEAELTEKIMAALLKHYGKVRKMWLKHDPDLELPTIESVDDMRKNVGLGTLHIMEIAKGGVAYYGLELGCTWDDEHGAGVLLHKDRIVDIGQADTSFNTGIATHDGGKPIKER